MRYLYLYIILFVIIVQNNAQDPVFIQYYNNPIFFNPAYTGTAITPRVSVNQRIQWPELPGQFNTSIVSFDQYLLKQKCGVGITVMKDQSGEAKSASSFGMIYSYRFKYDPFIIVSAIHASINQRVVDARQFRYDDMIHYLNGFVNTSSIDPMAQSLLNDIFSDFSIGFMGYTKNEFAGLSIHHIISPSKGVRSVLPMKLTLSGGYKYPLNKRQYLLPHAVYTHQQNYKTLDIGVLLYSSILTTGISYRNGFFRRNSLSITTIFDIYNSIKMGFSYDFTVSKVNAFGSKSAYEFSLIYYISTFKKAMRDKVLNCAGRRTKEMPFPFF